MNELPRLRKEGGSSATSPTLLDRARAQEPRAWQELVQRYGPLVFYWCRRQRLPSQDAPDVLQETFRAVAQSLKRFEKDRPDATFRGWLRTIVRNKVRDRLRRLDREPAGEGGTDAQIRWAQLPATTEESAVGGDELENMSLSEALVSLRAGFEQRTWQAFWQTAVEGRPAPDVAKELGISAVSVRVAKSRVLRRLRAELGETGET